MTALHQSMFCYILPALIGDRTHDLGQNSKSEGGGDRSRMDESQSETGTGDLHSQRQPPTPLDDMHNVDSLSLRAVPSVVLLVYLAAT
jgi:hypothetical protein